MFTSMRQSRELLLIGITLIQVINLSVAQRVAPGVPPQQYVSKIHIFAIVIS